MTDETIKLLQTAIRKRGGQLASISPSAIDLCGIIDHWNPLHFHDRNRYGEEISQLKARIARLETKGQDE